METRGHTCCKGISEKRERFCLETLEVPAPTASKMCLSYCQLQSIGFLFDAVSVTFQEQTQGKDF